MLVCAQGMTRLAGSTGSTLRRAPQQLPTNLGAVLAIIELFNVPSGVAVVAAILLICEEKSVAESGCDRIDVLVVVRVRSDLEVLFAGGACKSEVTAESGVEVARQW